MGCWCGKPLSYLMSEVLSRKKPLLIYGPSWILPNADLCKLSLCLLSYLLWPFHPRDIDQAILVFQGLHESLLSGWAPGSCVNTLRPEPWPRGGSLQGQGGCVDSMHVRSWVSVHLLVKALMVQDRTRCGMTWRRAVGQALTCSPLSYAVLGQNFKESLNFKFKPGFPGFISVKLGK